MGSYVYQYMEIGWNGIGVNPRQIFQGPNNEVLSYLESPVKLWTVSSFNGVKRSKYFLLKCRVFF